MEMKHTPGLELKPVGDDVSLHGLLAVAKDMLTPPVCVCPGKMSTGDLLQEVCEVQRLKHREVRGFLAVLLVYLLNEARPGKRPFVRADHDEERRKPILADGVYQQ